MAWRRRRAGRKRKADAPRYPSGATRHEKIEPPAEVLERRSRAFGAVAGGGRVQAETDNLIDVLWAAGHLDDRQRAAAQRLQHLIRARLADCAAPRAALQSFDGARAPGSGESGDRADLALEHRAALKALAAWRGVVVEAVAFNTLRGDVQDLSYGLRRLDAHFSTPRAQRLAMVERIHGV